MGCGVSSHGRCSVRTSRQSPAFIADLIFSGYAVASEISTISLRSHTQAAVTGGHQIVSWVFQFSVPYMIAPDSGNLGGKIVFIFGSFAMVVFVILFFLCPETKSM